MRGDPLFQTSSLAAPNWQLLSSVNPVFRVYVTHASVLVLKMLLMGIYTSYLRLKKQVSKVAFSSI